MSNLDTSSALNLLSHHIGKGNGLSARQMAQQLGVSERHFRLLIEALRNEGVAVCATPKNGYYIAATAEELEQTCEFLYSRLLCSAVQISRMKKIPLPDLRGQLHLPT